jgi:hypothetical protein
MIGVWILSPREGERKIRNGFIHGRLAWALGFVFARAIRRVKTHDKKEVGATVSSFCSFCSSGILLVPNAKKFG